MPSNNEIIVSAVDIGNSRIKLLIKSDFFAFEYDTNWKSAFRMIFNDVETDMFLCYSSVNSFVEIEFLQFLNEFINIKYQKVTELLSKQKLIDFTEIKGIGSDRMLGMIGALSYSEPPFITIDCGSAVTVNSVAEDRKCLGGAVFPGAYSQLNSLQAISEKLKNDRLTFNRQSPGKTTSDAIDFGVSMSIAGGIKFCIDSIIKNELNGNCPKIYITGGYSGRVKSTLNDFYIIENKSQLVLDGIIRLLE
jgi:pantothenate kinase type III